MITLTKSQALRMLIAARFIIGASSWFLPTFTARVMFIDAKANPALPYPLRLFGVRDVLMGVWILTSEDKVLDRHLNMSVATDLIDVAASGITGLTGHTRRRSAIFCCGAALIGALLGAAALGKGPLARKTVG